MKRVAETISDNERQIIEVVILLVSIIIPYRINLQEIFKDYLPEQPISLKDALWQLALARGGLVAAIIMFSIALVAIRKFNKDFIMNRKHVYHDYCYAWYWFCAKILGIKKCNLVLVPIYTQFKLVIRATFSEYPLDESRYPSINNEPDCQLSVKNVEAASKEVNLILEDTYIIKDQHIPESKAGLKTIRISRNNGTDCNRHYSQKLIDSVVNSVRELDHGVTINVFATTNPMNTKHIAEEAFGLGERGNVERLYVFQQEKTGNRDFESNGHRIC